MVVNNKLSAINRRMRLIRVICRKRHITVKQLAEMFKVSDRTIRNDIRCLSFDYPLKSVSGRYGGGVIYTGNYKLERQYLNQEEIEFLERIKRNACSEHAFLAEGILMKCR